jgi:methylmalonyl-CoA/ethylmalonyl-CoA epimerase
LSQAVFDHVAVGAHDLADGWRLFGGVLGGSWVYGGDSRGFWWGQLSFRTGPKIELLRPTGGADAAFLERFLDARGAGPHHFNFMVSDIIATLSMVRAAGLEPVQVNLASPTWKEAFLHPRDAHGIVVQIAEQSGPPPVVTTPAELLAPGPAAGFVLIEHEVADLDSALRFFAGVLDGTVASRSASPDGAATAELTWVNGTRLRLVRRDPAHNGAVAGQAGRLRGLCFERAGEPFTAADRDLAADLAHRLGVPLRLCG